MKKTRINPGTILKWTILVTSVILLIAGLIYGGFDDVKARAVRICMECIGIG